VAKRATAPAKKTTRNKATRKRKNVRSLESLLDLDADLRARGYRHVIGSDDAGGAGCVAGPVVVASCCLLHPPSSFFLPIDARGSSSSSESHGEPLVSPSEKKALGEVNDCKELTQTQRQEIYDIVISHPNIFAVTTAQRSPGQIDEMNLARATQEAFAESIEMLVSNHNLPFEEVYAIVDGRTSPKLYASEREQSDSGKGFQKCFPIRPYVDGDANVYTVALASIVARVTRDAIMKELDKQYPEYGFVDHLGYGRRDHVERIHQLGSLEGVHRMSFKQVRGR